MNTKQKLTQNWTWNHSTLSDVFGSQAAGGAVWEEGNLFTGNAVYGHQIVNVDNHESKGAAMLAVEMEFDRLKAYHEG